MSTLRKVKIGVNHESGGLYIYRHGLEENVALEKRDVEPEFMSALVHHMFAGHPDTAIGVTKTFSIDGKDYRLELHRKGD